MKLKKCAYAIGFFVVLYFIANIRLKKSEPSSYDKPWLHRRTVKYALKRPDDSEFFDHIRKYIDTNVKKLKIYIADIENEKNTRVIEKQKNFGHGVFFENFTLNSLISMNTDQYALDFITLNRLTNDYSVTVQSIEDANVIYIPFMLGSLCGAYVTKGAFSGNPEFANLAHFMAEYLRDNKERFKGKLIYFVYAMYEDTLGKYCMIKKKTKELFVKHINNLFMTTYAQCDFKIGQCQHRAFDYTVVLTTYPTVSKFKLEPNRIRYEGDINEDRVIDVFFGGTKRFGNPYRDYLYDNMHIQTDLEFDEFNRTLLHNGTFPANKSISVCFDIGYILNWKAEVRKISEWKTNSKLCLEPVGTAPTRRSFWDSVMLGCIPVIFLDHKLPFEDQIDYDRFIIRLNLVIGINITEIAFKSMNFEKLMKPYLERKEWIVQARKYIRIIRQFLQYSWPYESFGKERGENINQTFKYDAYGMMLAQLAQHLNKSENKSEETIQKKQQGDE